jgi:hypothetical protein
MDFAVLATIHSAGALVTTVHASSPIADPNPADNASSVGIQAVSPRAAPRRQSVHVHRRLARIALSCQPGGATCTGKLRLSRHAGHATYRVGSGGKGSTTVRLSNAALRALHRTGKLKLRATTVSDDHTATASGPVTLILRRQPRARSAAHSG